MVVAMKTQILLLLLVLVAMQCGGHRNNRGRNHGRYHRPSDYHHQKHDNSRERHRYHNYRDFPVSFEDLSQDSGDDVRSSRTPRSELEDQAVDTKSYEEPVKNGIRNSNISAMDTDAEKNYMDKGYSGIRVDEMLLDNAEPNNVDDDPSTTNINGVSLNSNDIPKNVENNVKSYLGIDSGDHHFGDNTGVNSGGNRGNLGFPLFNKPGLHLGGNFGVPFGGNLGGDFNSVPDFRLGGNPIFPSGVASNGEFGNNLGGNLGFPTLGIKDFHSIPYLHLGGNRGVPLGGNIGVLGGNLGNSDIRLGSNSDVNLRGDNLGADLPSLKKLDGRFNLQDLFDNNSKLDEKNNIDSDETTSNQNYRQPEDMDQSNKTINDIKHNAEDNVGNGGHAPENVSELLLDDDCNNDKLKSINTDIRGVSTEGNDTNDQVNKTDGESPSNHNDLNVDNPDTNNNNDGELPPGDSSIATHIHLPNINVTATDKVGVAQEIDAPLLNTNEVLISPEHDVISNTRPVSSNNHPTKIPSIKTSDKSNNKEEDGEYNQLEMIPVLLPGGGHVLLPSSILSNMPSYIVVMINGQPTLLQNPSNDVNGGSLDLNKFILATGLTISDTMLPSWYNIGAPVGGGGTTIGILPDLKPPASPLRVEGSDVTISPLANPHSESIPGADSVRRPIPTLPISVPEIIDPGFSPSFWNNNLDHSLQNPGPNVDWRNVIDLDTKVDSKVPNPTASLPTYPYPQYPYPYSYPPYFYSNYYTTYPFANENNYSGQKILIDDNNDFPHQKLNENRNDISSSDLRKSYPNVLLEPRPETHLDIPEGKLINAGLHPKPQPDTGVLSHLYTHPLSPQDEFHEPNLDVSIQTEHRDDFKIESYPGHRDDKYNELYLSKSIEPRFQHRDDTKIESSKVDQDDLNIIDTHPDYQHSKWADNDPDHRGNSRIDHRPGHRDNKWNKLGSNQWHDINIDPHLDHWDDNRTEFYPRYGADKRIEPQSHHRDDKRIEFYPQIWDDERIKLHTDEWDDQKIERHPDHWDDRRIVPHPDHRDDKSIELRPKHWDDKKVVPQLEPIDDKRINPHLDHWDDKTIESHSDHFDDKDHHQIYHLNHREDKRVDFRPDHSNDKRIESRNYWDDKRIESHPKDWDDERIESYPDHWDDKKIEPYPDHWDNKDPELRSNTIQSHPDLHPELILEQDYVPKPIPPIESHSEHDISLKHHPEPQADSPAIAHSEILANILFRPELSHGKPYDDVPGFHFTLPRPSHVGKSERTSLVNGLIDSLNILLKLPKRDGSQSKEIRSLIQLLLTILKPGDRNQMLVPKLNDDAEDELDLGNVYNLLFNLLNGYYEPDPKKLLDSSRDESVRTNLMLFLNLLANQGSSHTSKGTENPLLYFLGQFPCDLSKKQEEPEALSTKLWQLLADDYDRGDLQTRLERTAALVS